MSLTLLEWRREIGRIYAQVRTAADPHKGWLAWRDGRDRLFATHPDSPLAASARKGFTRLPVGDYDPGMRFVVPVEPAPPAHLDVPTGTDGIAPFDRIGVVTLHGLGSLDVWWLGSYGGGLFLPIRDGSAGRTSYGGGRPPSRALTWEVRAVGPTGSSSTSTSPTTPAAPTTRHGRARWRRRATRWRLS